MNLFENLQKLNESENSIVSEFKEFLVSKNAQYVASEIGETKDGMEIVIYDGDWKHEHLYIKRLLDEFFTNKGINISINSEEIGESDQDTFSARYDIKLNAEPKEYMADVKNLKFTTEDVSNWICNDDDIYVSDKFPEFKIHKQITSSKQEVWSVIDTETQREVFAAGTFKDAIEYVENKQTIKKESTEFNSFQIGEEYEWSGLYGGSYSGIVKNINEDSITLDVSWTAEDTGKLITKELTYDLETDSEGNIAFIVWRYSGEKGYVYPKNMSVTESNDINLSEYEYIGPATGYNTGWSLYRKIVDGKGVWVAKHQHTKEMVPINYDQVQGFEPIKLDGIKKLQKDLGDMLLPKRESKYDYREPIKCLQNDEGDYINVYRDKETGRLRAEGDIVHGKFIVGGSFNGPWDKDRERYYKERGFKEVTESAHKESDWKFIEKTTTKDDIFGDMTEGGYYIKEYNNDMTGIIYPPSESEKLYRAKLTRKNKINSLGYNAFIELDSAKEFLDKKAYDLTPVTFEDVKEQLKEIDNHEHLEIFISEPTNLGNVMVTIEGILSNGEPITFYDSSYISIQRDIDFIKEQYAKASKEIDHMRERGYLGVKEESLIESNDEDYDDNAATFLDTLEKEVKEAAYKFMLSAGFPEDEADDYLSVSTDINDDYIKVAVGAELGYDSLFKLCQILDKVIAKHDKDAYFEPECPGRIVAYLFGEKTKEAHKEREQALKDKIDSLDKVEETNHVNVDDKDYATGEEMYNEFVKYLNSLDQIAMNGTDCNWEPSEFNAKNLNADGEIYLECGAYILIYPYINEWAEDYFKVIVVDADTCELSIQLKNGIERIFNKFKTDKWKLVFEG